MKTEKTNPPKLPLRFFRWYCHPKLVDFIEGDLLEEYYERVRESGKRKADRKLIIDVLLLFRPEIIRPAKNYRNLNSTDMFLNYLKIAYRNLLKNKTFTTINVFGLVLGMTACLLLINYISFETSFDTFNYDSQNKYRITHEFFQKGELKSKSAAAFSPLAATIQNEIPEVSAITRLHPISGTINYSEEKSFRSFYEEQIYFTDPSFFKIFSFNYIYGSNNPLDQPNTAVITKYISNKYFGEKTNPIGRVIHWNDGSNKEDFVITAVIEDLPENSHLEFDILFSFSTLEILEATSMVPLYENWGWPGFYTYVQIIPNADIPALETKINTIVDSRLGEIMKNSNDSELKFHLQPLTDIHLHSTFSDELSANGDASTVRFLGIIAAIILIIAYFNYVNLSTVRSLERAKEVGIRKLMGSQKWQLVKQFLLESFLINLIALFFSCLFYYLTLNNAHYFTAYSLKDTLWTGPYLIPILLFLLFLGPILSSFYPALVLSEYKPVVVLKGGLKGSPQGNLLRKGLVIAQFATSVAMVTGMLIVYKQIQFMRNKDLGINLEQILILNGPKILSADKGSENRIESFKEALLQYPSIKNVSVSSAIPGKKVKGTMMYKPQNEEWVKGQPISTMKTDENFIKTYEAKMKIGRGFSAENQRDLNGQTLLMNEEAAFLLGFNDPESALQQILVSAMGDEREVVGIVKTYHQHSVAQDYEPMIFIVDPEEKDYISIKVTGNSLNGYNDIQDLLHNIEAEFKHYYPGNAFDYFFLDKFFDQQYQAQINFGRLFAFFSILAIIVAGLGLFGLASYTSIQRTKEIGIRKILGASVLNIFALLSKDYIKLIFIAFFIAVPFAKYFVTQWLENFSFRIEVTWWLFAISGLMVLIISLISIIGQSLKTAANNPVDNLRYE